MSKGYHVPVLPDEVLDCLKVNPSDKVADLTGGGGGHSALLLEAIPQGELVILDRDPMAISVLRSRFGDDVRAHVVKAPFSSFDEVLDQLGWQSCDKVLLDLGVSSAQLDTPERGFSFRFSADLDMRMDTESAGTVLDLLRVVTVKELTRILKIYGDVSRAKAIAELMKERFDSESLKTTQDLVEIVVEVMGRPRPGKIHPATTVFQALRIAVNQELEELEQVLLAVVERLAPEGRVAVISYHSLEDRLVKQSFREWEGVCHCPRDLPVCACGYRSLGRVVTRKPIKASEQELAVNPRSRSARLRVFEKGAC